MILRVAALITFSTVVLGFAALTQPRAHAKPNTTLTTLRPFDSFGTLGHCDLGARLDNFAIQLQHDTNYVGLIVAYGPEGEGLGSGRQRLALMKDYLVNARGLPERRIKTIYGGRNRELIQPWTELWIAPPGAPRITPQKFDTNIDTFKGMFYEETSGDYVDLVWVDEMGPGIGLSVDAAFADMMQEQKKSVPYIVAYNGEAAAPGAARRAAASQLEALKSQNVDTSRIKTIFAGVRKKTTIQLWITAPGDPPPATAAAAADPPPIRNVKITSQDEYSLGVAQNERAVFNRILEVLREQQAVKAVVIVLLESKQPEPDPEPQAAPIPTPLPTPPNEPEAVEEPDPPPADLPKLIEKWRQELITTHKIRPERFIVLFAARPPDESGNYLDLWIAAPGQPLPDPSADDYDEDLETPASNIIQDPTRGR